MAPNYNTFIVRTRISNHLHRCVNQHHYTSLASMVIPYHSIAREREVVRVSTESLDKMCVEIVDARCAHVVLFHSAQLWISMFPLFVSTGIAQQCGRDNGNPTATSMYRVPNGTTTTTTMTTTTTTTLSVMPTPNDIHSVHSSLRSLRWSWPPSSSLRRYACFIKSWYFFGLCL